MKYGTEIRIIDLRTNKPIFINTTSSMEDDITLKFNKPIILDATHSVVGYTFKPDIREKKES